MLIQHINSKCYCVSYIIYVNSLSDVRPVSSRIWGGRTGTEEEKIYSTTFLMSFLGFERYTSCLGMTCRALEAKNAFFLVKHISAITSSFSCSAYDGLETSMRSNGEKRNLRRVAGLTLCALAFLAATQISGELSLAQMYDPRREESNRLDAGIRSSHTLLKRRNVNPTVENVSDSSLRQTNVTHTFENVTDHILQQTNVAQNAKNDTEHTRQGTNMTHTVKIVKEDTVKRPSVTHTVEKVTVHTPQRTDMAHSVEKVTEYTVKQKTKKKYLLYFSQSGFANQMICLTHAYMMARMLNRVLLLPPILPHQPQHGGGSPFFVISKRTHEFPTADSLQRLEPSARELLDPFHIYLKRLHPRQYLPLGKVLDLNLTLPGIETMDVREFYNKVYKNHISDMTRATIEIDYGYSNMNTIWIQNLTTLEGETMTNVKRNMYSKPHILNMTYRDIKKTLVGTGSPSSQSMLSSSSGGLSRVVEVEDPDILVYLDTFKTQFHKSLYKKIPKSVKIMTPSIRQTVRDAVMVRSDHQQQEPIDTVRQDKDSNWPQFYAAVHIRGGDDHFLSAIDETIQYVFKGITAVIVKWLKGNSHRLPKEESIPVVGLYIATDAKNIHQNPAFSIEALKLRSLLTEEHNVHLILLFPEDSLGTGGSWKNKTKKKDPKAHPTVTSMLGGILYADLFWDIQVCACAPIGFVGSQYSTLSSLMQGDRSIRC